LALARVQLAELFNQIAVTPNDLRHKVPAALFRDPGRFVMQ
jgi:hypothetical protein